VWKELLKSNYGVGIIGRTELGDEHKPWFASLWWRDICSIGHNLDHNWFAQAVTKKLGNGVLTSFWRDKWVGESPLCDRFPRLFSISTQKEASVAEMRNPDSISGDWRLEWRRRFFEWEKVLLNDLMMLINTASLSLEEDGWGWMPEGGAAFTVKSTYHTVSDLSAADCVIAQWFMPIFTAIWKCPAPSKVSGFVWQLLHGRIATRNNLVARQIMDARGDVSCALCGEEKETEFHLFLYCEIAMLVWIEIFNWLNVPFGLPHNLFSLLHCLLVAGTYKMRLSMIMIALAVVWTLWRYRNALLFDNGSGTVAEMVEAVKVTSWKWWLSRANAAQCLFYE
jgi:hypothetical protein